MFSKFLQLNRALWALAVFAAVAGLLSCGSSYQNTRNRVVTSRVFVSNPVYPSVLGGGSPALNIMDATNDLLSPFTVSLSSLSASVSDAGMMSLSPNHAETLVMSPRDSRLAVVSNATEAILRAVTLPGPSESFFVASDNVTALIAIPSAPVNGQASGVVEKLNSGSGAVSATIPIPGAHFLAPSPNGNQVLVFSDNVNTVVLLTPSLIGASGQPTTISPCTTTQVPACVLPAPLPTTFDHPVGAVFDPSGTTAYVLNCGPECGGTAAGVTAIDMTNTGNSANLVLASQQLNGATVGLLQGTQLYVAGNQVGTGGFLSVLNLASGISSVNCTTSVNCQSIGITDGYHTVMQMGPNGRLFVGSRMCADVCLSIFDTTKSALVATPKNSPAGDVTGIAPIPNRNVVYVCQDGLLRVYDTTTDQLETIPTYGQPDVIGQAIDVKVIDF